MIVSKSGFSSGKIKRSDNAVTYDTREEEKGSEKSIKRKDKKGIKAKAHEEENVWEEKVIYGRIKNKVEATSGIPSFKEFSLNEGTKRKAKKRTPQRDSKGKFKKVT
jgi:hypothetical protein